MVLPLPSEPLRGVPSGFTPLLMTGARFVPRRGVFYRRPRRHHRTGRINGRSRRHCRRCRAHSSGAACCGRCSSAAPGAAVRCVLARGCVDTTRRRGRSVPLHGLRFGFEVHEAYEGKGQNCLLNHDENCFLFGGRNRSRAVPPKRQNRAFSPPPLLKKMRGFTAAFLSVANPPRRRSGITTINSLRAPFRLLLFPQEIPEPC